MPDLAKRNDRSAPVRRDLSGDELIYELEMLMSNLQPGDTLLINRQMLYRAGASLEHVLPPSYPHERWSDDVTSELCVKRTG